jgi:hypothetical protein
MLARVAKTFGALLLAVAFVLNGAVMQLGHAKVSSAPMAMTGAQLPCADMEKSGKHHPCCPKSHPGKAACLADCCTSIVPALGEPRTLFTFIEHRQKPIRVAALQNHIPDLPARPPQA